MIKLCDANRPGARRIPGEGFENERLPEAAGLVDGMDDGGDYGGSEDEPDEGDAFEEPVEVADHGSSR